jgi:hypothetical protein
MNNGWLVDAVWRMTPRLKTIAAEAMRPYFRPRISAVGAARRAPRKVPAERIETIRESSPAEREVWPGLAKVRIQ